MNVQIRKVSSVVKYTRGIFQTDKHTIDVVDCMQHVQNVQVQTFALNQFHLSIFNWEACFVRLHNL